MVTTADGFASGEQNAKESSFLRLPPEIRNNIYELALSHKVLHMSVRSTLDEGRGSYAQEEYFSGRKKRTPSDYEPHLRVTHVICRLPLHAQEDAYDLSLRAPTPHENDQSPETYVLSHTKCYTDLSRIKHFAEHSDAVKASKLRHQQVNLGFLRTCKQVYNEACLLPYTDNTFAFHESETFNLFIRTLGTAQREAITTIHIDGFVWYRKMLTTFEIPVIKMLKGLRTLHFTASGLWFPTGPMKDILKFHPTLAFAVLQKTTTFKVTYTYDTSPPGVADRAGRRAEAWRWEDQLRTHEILTATEKRAKRKREASDHADKSLQPRRSRNEEAGGRDDLRLDDVETCMMLGGRFITG